MLARNNARVTFLQKQHQNDKCMLETRHGKKGEI